MEMKRLVGIALTVALGGAAMAQSFTIRQPVEGSIVRETVDILIPAGSIPAAQSYIGVAVNGKFLEATMPPLAEDEKNYVYKLNTKERGIPDGEMEISIMLYMDFAENTEIVNNSSVKVILDNHTSIKIPDDGILLRYQFELGRELVYKHSTLQTEGLISQAQASLGSRAGQIGAMSEDYRYIIAFDNVYDVDGNKEALMRFQGLADKGKNYTHVTARGDEGPTQYFDYEMAPIYIRVDDTGREVWGSVPPYFPIEGTSGELSLFNLYIPPSLPVRPTDRMFPGDRWESFYLFSGRDLDRLYEQYKVTRPLKAQGTLVGVEWEKGIPCAKIFITVAQDTRQLAGIENLNQQPGEASKVEMTGTIWFSLDSGYLVKSVITTLQESLVTVGTAAGGGGAQAAGGTGGGPGFAGSGDDGGGGSVGDINYRFDPHFDSDGRFWLYTGPQNQGPSFGAPGGAGSGTGGAQGPGFGNRAGGGSAGAVKRVLIIKSTITTELELD